MLTLHKLFFKKFLKGWLILAITCVLLMTLKVIFKESVPEFIDIFMLFMIVFGPIGYAVFTNNDFQENLDWLINYQYNRKQLITFYITSQSVKLFLTAVLYSSYFLPIYLFGNKVNKSSEKDPSLLKEITEFFFSMSGASLVYTILIVGVFIVFFGSLFKSNAEVIRRQVIINKSKASNQLMTIFNLKNKSKIDISIISASVLGGLLLLNYGMDIFIAQVVIIAGVGFFSISLFNRKFKSLTPHKEKLVGLSLSVTLIVPYFLFVFGAIHEIPNNKLSIQTRIDAIEFTKLFHTPSKEVLVELVSENKNCGKFYSLSYLLGEQSISSIHLFKNVPEKCHIYKALSQYSKFGISNDLVIQIQKYINDNNLSEDTQVLIAAKLIVKGSPIKFSKNRFMNYLASQHTFTSFLGLRMAKRSLRYKSFKSLVKEKLKTMNHSMKKLGTVKRAIASVDKKKVEKSKNLESKNVSPINYDKY